MDTPWAGRRWWAIAWMATLPASLFALSFDEWRELHFTPPELADDAISGALADPDTDALANLQEFSMSLDPRANDASGVVAVVPDGSVLRLTYREAAAADGLTRWFQSSPDLRHWITHNAVTEASRQAESGFDRVTVEMPVPAGAARQFGRLRLLLDFAGNPLRPPTAVAADLAGPAGATIQWSDNSPAETGYAVERRGVDETAFTRLGTVPADTITYFDPAPTSFSYFYYRILAMDATGETASEESPLVRPGDSDRDGLDDAFEWALIQTAQTDADPANDHLQTLADITGTGDFDGDGRSNEQEAYDDATATLAADYFNGNLTGYRLAVVGGDGQPRVPGQFALDPVMVLVEAPDGSPAVNCPVEFEAAEDDAAFALTPLIPPVQHLTARTNSLGIATVYMKFAEEQP